MTISTFEPSLIRSDLMIPVTLLNSDFWVDLPCEKQVTSRMVPPNWAKWDWNVHRLKLT